MIGVNSHSSRHMHGVADSHPQQSHKEVIVQILGLIIVDRRAMPFGCRIDEKIYIPAMASPNAAILRAYRPGIPLTIGVHLAPYFEFT